MTTRSVLTLTFAVALAAVGAVWIRSLVPPESPSGSLQFLSAAPELPIFDRSGHKTDLSREKGGLTIVHFWATWCPPCQREMPLLSAAQQQHTNVTFLFANQGESSRLVRQYLATRAPLLKNVLLDTAGQFPVHIGSQALPVTLFFSSRGFLLSKHVGELSESALGQ